MMNEACNKIVLSGKRILLLLLLLPVLSQLLAAFDFRPPYREVTAWLDGNNVRYKVYDASRSTWMEDHQYSSTAPANLTSDGGVIAWTRGDRVYYAVYDPLKGDWEVSDNNEGIPPSGLTIASGVVAWFCSSHALYAVYDPQAGTWKLGETSGGAAVSSLLNADGTVLLTRGYYINYAQYDQAEGNWMVGGESGSSSPSSLVNADGVVAWIKGYRVAYGVYDPLLGAWKMGETSGSSNPTNLAVTDATVTFTRSGQTLIRGYDHDDGDWYNGTTLPFSYFIASPAWGSTQHWVYFRDMSIGANTFDWGFGDGQESEDSSPLHSFSLGRFYVSLYVTGPGGNDTYAAWIKTDTAAPTGSLTINNGAATTTSTSVGLTLAASDNSGTVAYMRFSNDNSTWSAWEPYATTRAWTLTAGAGTKAVYAQFQDAAQNDSTPCSDTIVLEAVALQVLVPNGGESWMVSRTYAITWTSSGPVGDVGIDYSTDNGGSWASIVGSTANTGSYSWTIPSLTPSAACRVRVRESDGDPSDASDAPFAIVAYADESVSVPATPSGPDGALIGISGHYATGGALSNWGDAVQYRFEWGDGSDSGWLAVGITSAAKIWSAPGTYHVRAKARCSLHTTIESVWSAVHPVVVYDGSLLGSYNSPAQYKVLPEVIWASATGGGTWMSSVQVTDVSGGSIVSVYYNTATGRRGPFQLWDNSGGAALSSAKYANLLETIDNLDPGTFTYFGTVGSVEFITQDGVHAIHAAARTQNGYYAKTFTALSIHDANTATTSRAMVVSNLTNNAGYRSTAGFFNPTTDSVTVEFTLLDAGNSQVGSQFSKTLAGHEFQAFNPFIQAGVPYPGASYDNVILRVRPTSGSGKVLCFGATVDNTTNDPAAHVTVQVATGYDNGPDSQQILPEAIWAAATGGGTWVSEVQIVDTTGGSQVSVYFDYGGGNRRGPFTLWTGGAAGTKEKYTNLLETIDNLDTEVFTYYGRVGAVEFQTQDGSHWIQVTARTLNGNYSKTFPGLNLVNAETADTTRTMLIQNYTNNAGYRSTSGFFNPTADSVTVEFTLLDNNGGQIGTQFSKTLEGYDFQAFNPFTQAGVPYPANSYDNVILRIRPTSGAGKVMCFGASVDNTSNDPASHLAVQGE